MFAAQEMFKTANKVTRPEKALILGFMAGSRGGSPGPAGRGAGALQGWGPGHVALAPAQSPPLHREPVPGAG